MVSRIIPTSIKLSSVQHPFAAYISKRLDSLDLGDISLERLTSIPVRFLMIAHDEIVRRVPWEVSLDSITYAIVGNQAASNYDDMAILAAVKERMVSNRVLTLSIAQRLIAALEDVHFLEDKDEKVAKQVMVEFEIAMSCEEIADTFAERSGDLVSFPDFVLSFEGQVMTPAVTDEREFGWVVNDRFYHTRFPEVAKYLNMSDCTAEL